MKRIIESRRGDVEFSTQLKVGDTVMVLSGGNKKKGRILQGKTGKLLRIFPKKRRVVVEGLNMVKRHKRAMAATEAAGIIEKEGSIHISNVMFYSEDLKRPVRLTSKRLQNGRKVRGYKDPKSGAFEQIDV